MAKHTGKRDLFLEVTNTIVAIMESGRIPWRKEWKDEGGNAEGINLEIPHNPFTGRNYHGINTILLWHAQSIGNNGIGHARPVWLTYKPSSTTARYARCKLYFGEPLPAWEM